jgi:hypothetical protein
MRSNQIIIELVRALTTVANRNTTQSTSKQEHSQDGLFIGDRKQEDRIAYLVSFVNSKENSRIFELCLWTTDGCLVICNISQMN